MMTPAELARAILWGPLTPVRFRKAARLVTSREHFAAMLAAVPDDAKREQIRAGMTALVEAQH